MSSTALLELWREDSLEARFKSLSPEASKCHGDTFRTEPLSAIGAGLDKRLQGFGLLGSLRDMVRKEIQQQEKINSTKKCAVCKDIAAQPWRTSCGHFICETPCLLREQLLAAEEGDDNIIC